MNTQINKAKLARMVSFRHVTCSSRLLAQMPGHSASLVRDLPGGSPCIALQGFQRIQCLFPLFGVTTEPRGYQEEALHLFVRRARPLPAFRRKHGFDRAGCRKTAVWIGRG